MAGPIVLGNYYIRTDESQNEFIIENIETGEQTVITSDGITGGSIAQDYSTRDLLPEGEQTGLEADSTGVKYIGKSTQYIDPSLIDQDRNVYFEAAIESSANDETVTAEIYDKDRQAVLNRQEIQGGSTRTRTGDISKSLYEGHEIAVRYNVTSASSTSGATFSPIASRLLIR